jgi:NAD(P)-dependent dehydrogenase (short-subunit alcohol dehydrogenase family)
MRHVTDLFRLSGRKALVTGGARGLGAVMAAALAEAGADVAITSRAIESARQGADTIASETGRTVVPFACDVLTPQQVEDLRTSVEATFGPIDILVNNAGLNIRGTADALTEADWDAVIDTNLKGPFFCARAFGPGMCERGWGRVINLSSMLGTVALPGRAPYASSKFGVVGLTKVLALEWAARGVTVNAICPGPFATEMNRALLADPVKYAEFVQKLPLGRWGELEEIKGITVYLASDASSFMTGSAVVIDGGWTAQ